MRWIDSNSERAAQTHDQDLHRIVAERAYTRYAYPPRMSCEVSLETSAIGH
jgi:hypothetical protein